MNRKTAFALSGAALGFFAGSSMGIAAGGDAYNGALFLTPLGAFIGWLLVAKDGAIVGPKTGTEKTSVDPAGPKEAAADIHTKGSIELLFHSALSILAALWNFHIDALATIGLLPTFVRQPILFAGLVIVISAFFPPFLAIYFCAWLGANHFGLNAETQYRVTVK